MSQPNFSSAKKHTAKLHRLSLHNDFLICENNIPHKGLSTLKRHHKTSTCLKPHAGKVCPNHSPLNSSSHTPILSMYHLSHYSICVSKPFFVRNFSSAKNEKPLLIHKKNSVYMNCIQYDWWSEKGTPKNTHATKSHTSILDECPYLRKLFICENIQGRPCNQLSCNDFSSAKIIWLVTILISQQTSRVSYTPQRLTQRRFIPITSHLYPVGYLYIISANIPYARVTLSLSENLHLQKEVLLIRNNSFYIHKLFLV